MDKIINLLINNWTKGVDTYTHNGSTWLIFPEQKSWVIELTQDKTLWYNYNFFRELFSLTSMDVVENQHYITKWVEDNIINGVNHTNWESTMNELLVDDVIENGVKETQFNSYENKSWVGGVIKEGVKHTEYGDWLDGDERLDEIVENGVKETNHVDVMKFFDNKMEDTLENGIRLTEYQIGDTFDEIDDIIENGVKFTFNTEYMPKSMVVDIIENGVKSSIPRQYVGKDIIDKVIDKGVIETHREICEYKHTVEHIIQTGVKETKHANKYESIGPVIKEVKINHIIDNGVKVSGTFVGGNRQKENIESVIGYGTKNPTD